VTLVISPLVSLMDDQVMGLLQLGIDGRMFTADTSKEDTKKIYNDILNPKSGTMVCNPDSLDFFGR
jgi:superfamily II DNA helicase RecQ